MNREQIVEWLERPSELGREERLIRLLMQESERADRLSLDLMSAQAALAAVQDGSAVEG